MAEKENKYHHKTPDEIILEIVDGMSPSTAKKVLDAYNHMSFTVKNAVNEFYAALDNVTDKDSISTIKSALKNLKEACDANPDYKDLYDLAKKEAQEEIAEVVANEGMNLLDDAD